MRKLICRLVFGADDLAQRTLALIDIRKAALAKHAANKEAATALERSRQEVNKLQADYFSGKLALQKAFELVLE